MSRGLPGGYSAYTRLNQQEALSPAARLEPARSLYRIGAPPAAAAPDASVAAAPALDHDPGYTAQPAVSHAADERRQADRTRGDFDSGRPVRAQHELRPVLRFDENGSAHGRDGGEPAPFGGLPDLDPSRPPGGQFPGSTPPAAEGCVASE